MTIEEKQWILSLPIETKLSLMEDALKQDKFGIFFEFTKLFLDTPISDGGISTEEIEEVRKKYF
tara:strand:+ start:366 stop:557 length:192 start_codon:yes stop_codon:yes gene_type:complete